MPRQNPSLVGTLRDCARVALERKGYVVRNKPGLGVPPGARFSIHSPGQAHQTVVVRVSKKRKIGISRHQWSGNWFEVPGLNEVIVVSPSLDDPMVADVFGFDAQKLIKIFDLLDTRRNGPFTEDRELNFPIFVALDPQDGDESNSISSNLIAEASWEERVSLAGSLASTSIGLVGSETVPARAANPSEPKVNHDGFLERVRREYAELNGVDVRKVFINIRYVEA
jgi:hypothetical protein